MIHFRDLARAAFETRRALQAGVRAQREAQALQASVAFVAAPR